MGIFIGQGVNSGYSIIAYSYFLSRVKESPKSAKMNLYLSWAAGSLWMFTGYGHSAIKNGSNQQKDLLKIELNSIATAYRLDPNSGIIVSDYGTVLWYQGRFNSNQSEMNKGMALLRQGVRLAPSLPNTHGALGLALEARDLGGKADNETISELQKAVELAPNNSCNHLYLGDAYLMNGDKEKASKEFSIATQLRGGEPMNPALFAKEPGSPWKGDMSISSPPLARNDHP
jgi:tetratricopeptide (TPR) repeat protein